jgi:hypothetical protein
MNLAPEPVSRTSVCPERFWAKAVEIRVIPTPTGYIMMLPQVMSFKVYFIGLFEIFGDLQGVLNLKQHIRN